MRTGIALAAGLAVMLGAATASASKGIVFVHGTGDNTQASALSNYWTQSSINSMAGSTPYLVVGYSGGSCNAKGFDINNNPCTGSWSTIGDQIASWASSHGITSIVIVTHSNGINPVRYMLAHKTATANVQTAMNLTRKVVSVAGDMKGTPLADKVFNGGSFDQTVGSAFGYNNAAVKEQITTTMATDNGNGTYIGGAGTASPGGVPMATVHGTGVSASFWSSNGTCGGYWLSVGLSLTRCLGWGCGACSDGFIGCDSATYQGTDVGNNGKTWNHNQSRRSCNGVASYITNAINSAPNWTTAPPPDYGTGLTPAGEACNATFQGWWDSNHYSYGCTSAMQTDGNIDIDCEAAYGYESVNSPTPNYSVPADYNLTAYSNNAYYWNLSAGTCSDSWLGDGICDLCLVAKY